MTENEYNFDPQPHATRVDSFAGFTETPLPFTAINSSSEDTDTKFAFSPQDDMMSFDPSTGASFSEGLQQTTVHPGVLSGSGLPMTDGGQNHMSDNFFAPQNIFTSMSNARSQHGQVTPPDDLSPKSMETKPTLPDDGDADFPVKVEQSTQPMKADNKRKRSTKASNGTPSRKRGRKTAVTVEEELDPEEKAKRDQFLERNRVAAHKCRQKKKEWVTKLDEEVRELSSRNKYLRAETDLLNNALFEMKNLVFKHTDCHFAPIDDFIAGEASRLSFKTRIASDHSMSMSMQHGTQQLHGAFPQAGSTGPGPSVFSGQGVAEPERSVERASTESSDFGSLRSRSTAPDGVIAEQWIDMLQHS